MSQMKIWFVSIAVLAISAAPIVAQKNSTLQGQVVCCAECWAEADRTKVEFGTAEDLLKAQSCVEGGDPTLLAVREGEQFVLYQLEKGEFKPSGKNWLEFIGKRVNVNGEIRRRGNTNILRVNAFEVIAPSLAEREATKVVGQEVELKLKDLSGGEQSLSSLKGRIVILNFWATYCIPCRKEMPDLTLIQNEYAALGVQVIGASTDEAKDRDKVFQFVKDAKINFPIWTGATTADMVRFGLGGALPGTVVLGKDGKIARVISGVINQAEMRKQIDSMLASPGMTAATVQNEGHAKVASGSLKSSEVSSVPS